MENKEGTIFWFSILITLASIAILSIVMVLIPTVSANSCVGATYTFACGETINETCSLDGDLVSSGTCFTIGDDSITIDGNGYNITGDNTGDGIYIENFNSAIIRNLYIDNFWSGITLNSSNSTTIFNNNFNLNRKAGIFAVNSNSNNITQNTNNNTYVSGVYVGNLHCDYPSSRDESGIALCSDSSNNIIDYFTLWGNYTENGTDSNSERFNGVDSGISIQDSNNNIINHTILYYPDTYGIFLNNAINTSIDDYYLYGSNGIGKSTNDGVIDGGTIQARNTTIKNSYADNTTEWGFFMNYINNLYMKNVTAVNSDGYGIRLATLSFNATITNCNSTQNLVNGIYVELGNNDTIFNNSVSYNENGIYLDYGQGNNVSSNIITDNEFGINFASLNLVIDNNKFYNNTNVGIAVAGSLGGVQITNNVFDDNYNNIDMYANDGNISFNQINDGGDGIYVLGGDNNTIQGNVIQDAVISGISIVNSIGNVVDSNIFNKSGTEYGIYITLGSGNSITNNQITASTTVSPIDLTSTSGNIVYNNTATASSQHGIILDNADSNNVSFNNASLNNGRGIHIYQSDSNNISNNEILNNWEYGIGLLESADNTIDDNNVYGITGIKLDRVATTGNTVSGNSITGFFAGIVIATADSNIFQDNNISTSWGSLSPAISITSTSGLNEFYNQFLTSRDTNISFTYFGNIDVYEPTTIPAIPPNTISAGKFVEIVNNTNAWVLLNVSYSALSNPVLYAYDGSSWSQVSGSIDEGSYVSANATSFSIFGPLGQGTINHCVGANYNFSCGDLVNESCTIDGNMNSIGTCLIFGDDNIVIEGNGYNITGDGATTSGRGIFAPGHNNLTIDNVVVINFSTGIEWSGTTNGFVTNNVVAYSTIGYNFFGNPINNTITDNLAIYCEDGVQITSGVNNSYYNMITINNTQFGMIIPGGNYDIFTDTRSCDNGFYDLYDNVGTNTWINSIYTTSTPNNVTYYGQLNTCNYVPTPAPKLNAANCAIMNLILILCALVIMGIVGGFAMLAYRKYEGTYAGEIGVKEILFTFIIVIILTGLLVEIANEIAAIGCII